jgi:hypothetical protein
MSYWLKLLGSEGIRARRPEAPDAPKRPPARRSDTMRRRKSDYRREEVILLSESQ